MTDPEKATISLHKPNSPAKSADSIPIRTSAKSAPVPATMTHLAALGWAFTDLPTIQAYQRFTGESVSPIFARYRKWAEENLIGPANAEGHFSKF